MISNLFKQLIVADIQNKYRAIEIPGITDAFLGSDEKGRPCFFLESNDNIIQPSLSTEHLLLSINQEYKLSFPDGLKRDERYIVLLCLSDSPEDIDTFLILLEAFLTNNKNNLKFESMLSFFHSLVRLFSIKPIGDIKSRRQGLWGELLLMRRVIGYAFWAPYWQTESNRLFDFSAHSNRVEVKTTLKPVRIHVVSHKQVFPQGNDVIFITSIQLREDDVGVSLRTLIYECREAFKFTPYYFKIENAIRYAKMQDPAEEGPKFSINEAEHSIRWFNSKDVPKFKSEEPEGVSGTHYSIDLTNSTPIDDSQLYDWLNTWHT